MPFQRFLARALRARPVNNWYLGRAETRVRRAADILHPTFGADIAPLVYSNCAVCHREGEAAPFSLLSYRDVQKHARQIVDITSRKVMPPWKPDAASPHFIGERRLSDSQIEMLKRWVDQGCAEGNPAAEPQPPKFTAGWQLGEPDMTVSMADTYTLAAEGRDVYRCFVIPVHIPAGKYLKAVEYRPQLRKIVHHAVLTTMSEHDAKATRRRAGRHGSRLLQWPGGAGRSASGAAGDLGAGQRRPAVAAGVCISLAWIASSGFATAFAPRWKSRTRAFHGGPIFHGRKAAWRRAGCASFQ